MDSDECNDEGSDRMLLYRKWQRLAQPYFRWQVSQFAGNIGDRVADVGCGIGNLTPYFENAELYLAVDVDLKLLDELTTLNSHQSNIQTLPADLTAQDFSDQLRVYDINTIVCANLIEHIADDHLAISNLCSALPAGGKLNVLVPAMRSIYGTLDELDGHYRRYDKRSLQDAFEGLPLKVVSIRYFNAIGALGWWIKGRVIKQATHTTDNYRVMNLLIPFMRPFESLIRVPFGLSLVVLLEKKR